MRIELIDDYDVVLIDLAKVVFVMQGTMPPAGITKDAIKKIEAAPDKQTTLEPINTLLLHTDTKAVTMRYQKKEDRDKVYQYVSVWWLKTGLVDFDRMGRK